MPGADCARSLVCSVLVAHECSYHGRAGRPAFPHAMVLTVSFVLSPVIGLFLSPSSAELHSANLTPASRRQDHTTSPSASSALVRSAARVHRIPRPTSVTIAKRPSEGTGRPDSVN
jgi:hypothetical protein